MLGVCRIHYQFAGIFLIIKWFFAAFSQCCLLWYHTVLQFFYLFWTVCQSILHSHFRSLFYLHFCAVSGVSTGRKGVSPIEFGALSPASSWILCFPLSLTLLPSAISPRGLSQASCWVLMLIKHIFIVHELRHFIFSNCFASEPKSNYWWESLYLDKPVIIQYMYMYWYTFVVD